MNHLQKHAFVATAMQAGVQVEREAFGKRQAGEIDSRPIRDLTEDEWYARACGFSLAHLLGLLQQLAQIPGYIRQYKRTSALAARDVTRASDVTYHLENFLIRSQSFQDRSLQLCSAVLHTGLDLRSIRFTDMMRNAHVRSAGLDVHLKAINKLCQPYSQARNQVVHQHGLLDADLRRIEVLLLASRAVTKPRRTAFATSYRFLVQELASRKEQEFDEFTRTAIGLCGKLFDSLEPQWVKVRTRLGHG